MSVEANCQLAREFLVAAGRGDVESLQKIIGDEIDFETMGCSVVSARRNRAEFLELVMMFDQFMKTPIEFEFLTFTAQDDRVAVEARSKAVMINECPYENIYHFLFWIRDGRVVRGHEYTDTKYVDQSVGLLATAKQ